MRRVALALHLGHRDVHLGHVRPHLVTGQDDLLVLIDLFLLAQGFARDDGSDRERQDLARRPRGAGRRGLGNRREGARRRGSGHVGRAETNETVAARLQEARTGQRRQFRGVGDTQDLARVALRERLERNAVRQVGFQAARLTQVHLLRSQQQVHRQGSAQTTDHDEDLAELRLGHEHFCELVQHDEQGRQRRILMLAGEAVRLVIGHVRVIAGLTQHLLAAHHLALQGVLHTVNQRELGLQVRDHGRHVRQVRHAGEGRATLEVDEHQVQLLGGVSQSQRENEGTQHLGLT